MKDGNPMNSLSRCRVKEVMSSDVVSVHSQDTVHEALVLMDENRISALPVTDRRGRCIGMVSASDMMDLTRELDDELCDLGRVSPISREWIIERLINGVGQHMVEELMSETVATISSETLLTVASQEMLRERVHRLPVVDHQRRLQGIISTMDIMAAVADVETH